MATLTDEGYLAALRDVREKLVDFSALMREGKVGYYKEIVMQLRLLYLFKSGRKSLLGQVGDRFGFEVIVFVMTSPMEEIERGVADEETIRLYEGASYFNLKNSANSWFDISNKYKNHEYLPIFEAIRRPELIDNNRRFSYADIIKNVGDKMAAHIDPIIDDEYIQIHGNFVYEEGLFPVAQSMMLVISGASIKLISDILDFIENGVQYPHIKPR